MAVFALKSVFFTGKSDAEKRLKIAYPINYPLQDFFIPLHPLLMQRIISLHSVGTFPLHLVGNMFVYIQR